MSFDSMKARISSRSSGKPDQVSRLPGFGPFGPGHGARDYLESGLGGGQRLEQPGLLHRPQHGALIGKGVGPVGAARRA